MRSLLVDMFSVFHTGILLGKSPVLSHTGLQLVLSRGHGPETYADTVKCHLNISCANYKY